MLHTDANTSATGTGVRTVWVSSNTIPPDQSGSDGTGSAGLRPTSSASAHDVVTSTSRVRANASSMARRNDKRSRGTERGDGVVAHDDLVLETVDQRTRQPDGQRRDQAHPVRRQPRRQHGNGHDEARPQPRDVRVELHHLLVGDDIGPADLEHLAERAGFVEHADEVGEHVTDRDRLAARARPTAA